MSKNRNVIDVGRYQSWAYWVYEESLTPEERKAVTKGDKDKYLPALPKPRDKYCTVEEDMMIFYANIFERAIEGTLDIPGLDYESLPEDPIERGLYAVKCFMTRKELTSVWPFIAFRLIAMVEICNRFNFDDVPKEAIVRASAKAPLKDGRFNRMLFIEHVVENMENRGK